MFILALDGCINEIKNAKKSCDTATLSTLNFVFTCIEKMLTFNVQLGVQISVFCKLCKNAEQLMFKAFLHFFICDVLFTFTYRNGPTL